MKPFDGMEGVVDEKGKNYLYISNLPMTPKNFIKYNQIGIFYGDTTGIEMSDTVRVYFKKQGNWKEKLREWTASITLNYGNIERVEFVKAGKRPKGIINKIKFSLGL